MDPELIGAVTFLVLLGLVLIIERKKIIVQKILFPVIYMIMYRTKVGINLMDKIAKKIPRFLKVLSFIGIIVGFLGMILLVYLLIVNLYDLITKPEAIAGVGLVLPIKAKGVFFVPFFYWIISIFILAVVHEFSHGVIARVYGMKVKSSGLAILSLVVPIIPAAFVEPDEKVITKRPHREQLSVFAAGPFSNVLFAFGVLALLLFVISPMISNIVDFRGVTIESFGNSNMTIPVKEAGIQEGETIIQLNDSQINIVDDLTLEMAHFKPGDTIPIITDKGEYEVTFGTSDFNESIPYLGVILSQKYEYKGWYKENEFVTDALLWATGMPQRVGWQLSYPVRGYGLGLLFWLYLLNIGIGLFNLIPIGPIDGGRMLQLPLRRFFGNEVGDKIWKYISIIVLVIVLITMAFAFI
ncbi:site-2 protease family protein [Nanoarchaeota archaeon]